MKILTRVGIVALFALSAQTLNAQVKAITEKGDTIYVYNNGTWSYELEDEDPSLSYELGFLDRPIKLDTISTPLFADEKAKKEVASQFEFFKIKYDDKTWKRIPPGEINPEAEFAFRSKELDIYCMVISEEIEIGADQLMKIALNNAEERTGSKIELVRSEACNVNGVDMLRGVYDIDLSGLSLRFETYFYSGPKGSLQFTAWTGKNIWGKYEKGIENFLNGLVVLD